MHRNDRICYNCGCKWGSHYPVPGGAACNRVGPGYFSDKDKYNVWMIQAARWTNWNHQDVSNPKHMSFQEAEDLLAQMMQAPSMGFAEIRIVSSIPKPEHSTIVKDHVPSKVAAIKVPVDEETRLRNILTGVQPGECPCKIPRSQCSFHK